MTTLDLPVLPPERGSSLRHALTLEYVTVGWNVIEGLIGVGAALAAGSVVLLGFGLDSFVETASGGILIWRLRREQVAGASCEVAELDRKAHRLVGASLVLLAAWVAVHAVHALVTSSRPESSVTGIVLTAVSAAVMMPLARAKRRAAAALQSRALEADAFQTTACWWLSCVTLAGVGLNTALGWWWADPVAALGVAALIATEAREAWRGEGCGCG